MPKKRKSDHFPQRQTGYPQARQTMQIRKDIPVQVFVPEDQFIDYTDAFAVSHSDEEFVISFLQLQYPIAITQEQLDSIKEAETVCVARIALTPKRMALLIEALQNNLNIYNAEREAARPRENPEQEQSTPQEIK